MATFLDSKYEKMKKKHHFNYPGCSLKFFTYEHIFLFTEKMLPIFRNIRLEDYKKYYSGGSIPSTDSKASRRNMDVDGDKYDMEIEYAAECLESISELCRGAKFKKPLFIKFVKALIMSYQFPTSGRVEEQEGGAGGKTTRPHPSIIILLAFSAFLTLFALIGFKNTLTPTEIENKKIARLSDFLTPERIENIGLDVGTKFGKVVGTAVSKKISEGKFHWGEAIQKAYVGQSEGGSLSTEFAKVLMKDIGDIAGLALTETQFLIDKCAVNTAIFPVDSMRVLSEYIFESMMYAEEKVPTKVKQAWGSPSAGHSMVLGDKARFMQGVAKSAETANRVVKTYISVLPSDETFVKCSREMLRIEYERIALNLAEAYATKRYQTMGAVNVLAYAGELFLTAYGALLFNPGDPIMLSAFLIPPLSSTRAVIGKSETTVKAKAREMQKYLLEAPGKVLDTLIEAAKELPPERVKATRVRRKSIGGMSARKTKRRYTPKKRVV